MSIRACKLMVDAMENPHEYEGKRYKVVEGSYLWFGADNRDECIIVNGRLTEKNRYSTFSVYADTVLEEIPPEPKPVPFMEAVKANEKGKRVECKIYGCFNVYKPTAASGMIDQSGRAVSANEILHGEWFIKGE